MRPPKESNLSLSQIHQIRVPDSAGKQANKGEEALRFRAPDGTYYLGDEGLEHLRGAGLAYEVVRQLDEEDLPVRFLLPHDGAVLDPPPADVRMAVLSRLLAEERADGSVHIRFLGRNRTIPADAFVLDRFGGSRSYVWQTVPAEEVEQRLGLEQRFSAIRSLVCAEDARVVLALGSGGLKLFAHAPALRLFEGLGLGERVEEIWGSSAGALAGLLYSHGFSPHAIEQLGYDLYSGRYRLALRPSKLQLLRHLLRDALMPSSGTAAAGFVDVARGLSGMLDRYCTQASSRRPFYCTAFNLAECRPQVLTPETVPEHLQDLITQADAREAALASAAVPLLFVPKLIRHEDGETPYIDGSTTEDVPLHSALLKFDLDRAAGIEPRSRLVILYVKLTGSLGAYSTRTGRVGKFRLLQTVAAAGIETMHRRAVSLAQQRDDVELLGLELGDTAADFFDTERIPHFIRAAKEAFPAQLGEIERELRSRNERRGERRSAPRRSSAATGGLAKVSPWMLRVFRRASKP